ncbi:MAG: hypothetical protein CMD40_04095 [Gammaproteobacteria bacterium]|nr:hypothetical protein [Gammaproteobacteria bacterium]
MGSKSKKLVKNRELSNLYLDISEEILKKLTQDNNNNKLLFLMSIENSLSHLADDIFDNFKNDLESIENLNYKYKWNELSNLKVLRNIITKELDPNGLINLIETSKSIFFRKDDKNLIITTEINDLKKFNLILNKYKAFKELLRKTLDEC